MPPVVGEAQALTFNLADLFESVAAAVPDRLALVCDGRRLTFAEVDDRADRLARVLAGRGVADGHHVGLHLWNGNEYVEAMLACFKLRAVPVNVNYRYVADELRYLFTDADLTAVVTEPALQETLAEAGVDVPVLVRGEAYERALAEADGERGGWGPRSGDDLYVLYTGGTTGMPKGVMWRHEDLFFAALGGGNPDGAPVTRPQEVAARATQGFHRALVAPPFIHGAAHWMALRVLLAGGTVVVDRDPGLVPERVWELASDERAAFLVIVGDAFARPLADALAAAPGRWDLDALTAVLSGGAILSPAVKQELLRLLPHALVVDGFGASETGGQGQVVTAFGGREPGTVRVRFAANDDSTAVLDDTFRPLPPGTGQVGWVARRGHIPLGYYKDAAKTARTFPVVDGMRWAVPGDRAQVEVDGSITVLGRGSTTVNTGGEKVYPEEVEAVLKGHPAVFDALVVGMPDTRWGERVVAVVAPRADAVAPTLDELDAHCRESLAAYKVPRDLVVVDEVRRSPSGKPDYRWAREAAAGNSFASRERSE